MLIVILALVGAFFLYNKEFAVSVPAAGEWKNHGLAAISIDKDELKNIPPDGTVGLEITAKDGQVVSFPASVTEITPQNGVVVVKLDEKAPGVVGKKHFDLRVVFSHAKLWQFLLSKSSTGQNE
jgi:hypothetical protein